MICFPSTAPMQWGKFHLSLKLFSIALQSSIGKGKAKHESPISEYITVHNSKTMYEIARHLNKSFLSGQDNGIDGF